MFAVPSHWDYKGQYALMEQWHILLEQSASSDYALPTYRVWPRHFLHHQTWNKTLYCQHVYVLHVSNIHFIKFLATNTALNIIHITTLHVLRYETKTGMWPGSIYIYIYNTSMLCTFSYMEKNGLNGLLIVFCQILTPFPVYCINCPQKWGLHMSKVAGCPLPLDWLQILLTTSGFVCFSAILEVKGMGCSVTKTIVTNCNLVTGTNQVRMWNLDITFPWWKQFNKSDVFYKLIK